MNFQLKHRGFAVAESLKVAIAAKMKRFEAVLPEASFVEIELSKTRESMGQCVAEVVLDIPGNSHVVRYTAKEVTWLAAVDTILDKLDDELARSKDRQHDYHYRGQSPKEWLADHSRKDGP